VGLSFGECEVGGAGSKEGSCAKGCGKLGGMEVFSILMMRMVSLGICEHYAYCTLFSFLDV
jgi:hypothetical protein